MKENEERLLDEILVLARASGGPDANEPGRYDGGEIPEAVVRRSEQWIARARSARRPPRWPWALAAAAVLILVAFLPRGDDTNAPRLRARSAESVRSLLPDGVLSRADPRLLWSPGPDGSVYRVTLFSPELKVLGSAENLSVAEFRVPEEVLAGISGDDLVWRVEVFPPGGGDGFSETFTARLGP